MKKSVKITLIIAASLLIVAFFVGYQVYKTIQGNEKIIGKLDGIPNPSGTIPPVTIGESDWPNWRGIKFDGKSTTKNINKDWSKGLKKLWQVDYLCQGTLSATWSSPVIQGNRLIITGRDDKNDFVFCLNTNDGALIWKGTYATEAETSHGQGARATPFIDHGRVYTFGRNGDLACWNLEDGKLFWKQNVKEQGGKEPDWGFSSTPLVFENKVIVQGGGTALILAFDKITGNVIWKSMAGEAGYAAAIPISVENELELLIYHGKGLSLVNPGDGKELWRVPWETDYSVNATTPVIEKDIVFHTAGYGMGGQTLKISKKEYKKLWKSDAVAAQHSDPIVINGFIYSYSGESSNNKNGLFKCIELTTGKEMWSTNQIGQGTLTYADGYLICLDIKGNLYLVEPNPSSFRKIGEIKNAIEGVKNPAWTLPVVANGQLYLRYLQHIICYSLK
jgi:outer membrane protein assembly factor BamB